MKRINKNFLRAAIFILIIILSMQVLFACASDNNSGDTPVNGENGNENNKDDDIPETTELSDDIPALNFNGEEISVLYGDYIEFEIYAETENGEPVNDAVYRRNLAIEERFNVKFKMIPTPGAWDHKDAYLKRIRNSVSAGDNEFEIITGYAAFIVDLTSGGYLSNWKNIPHVNFEKPWWNQDFISEMTVNNSLYYITGDLALTTIWNANVLFFNKNMWQNYGFESPYSLVKENKWTLDKMSEITKQVSDDVDDDGKYTVDDLYGYVTDTHNQIDAYVVSFDVPVTIKGEDGLPQYVIQDEKFASAFMRLYEFTRENLSTFAGTDQPTATAIYSIYRPIFQAERALILAEYLGNSSQMRSYEFDFGILPFPKLDESQEKYKTMPWNGYSMFCTPVTVQNTEKVGAVIEALAAESHKSVVPAFYDIALKTKYARDDESAEMIDIIREGTSFNFGMEYVVPLGSPHLQWRSLITNKKTNIVSEVERQMNVWQKNLDKILEVYQ